MRLFIAINFNSKTRKELLALCDELRKTSNRGRFSLPENLHLTLVFLGKCNAKQTAAAKTIMDGVTFAPFDLKIDSIGRFKRNGGDLWWAGVRENSALLDLHQKLSDGLKSNGFQCEERKYSPHITLGREIATKIQPWQIEPFGEMVSQIYLMKSERIAGKLAYTAIHVK